MKLFIVLTAGLMLTLGSSLNAMEAYCCPGGDAPRVAVAEKKKVIFYVRKGSKKVLAPVIEQLSKRGIDAEVRELGTGGSAENAVVIPVVFIDASTSFEVIGVPMIGKSRADQIARELNGEKGFFITIALRDIDEEDLCNGWEKSVVWKGELKPSQDNDLYDEWFLTMGDKDVDELLKKLGYASSIAMSPARTMIDAPTDQHTIAISGHIDPLKPQPAIYEYLLTRYDLDPNACIFIDDLVPEIAKQVPAAQEVPAALNVIEAQEVLEASSITMQVPVAKEAPAVAVTEKKKLLFYVRKGCKPVMVPAIELLAKRGFDAEIRELGEGGDTANAFVILVVFTDGENSIRLAAGPMLGSIEADKAAQEIHGENGFFITVANRTIDYDFLPDRWKKTLLWKGALGSYEHSDQWFLTSLDENIEVLLQKLGYVS
jgi:hypothetical protein